MSIELLERFLADEIGINKRDREKIVEYVKTNFHILQEKKINIKEEKSIVENIPTDGDNLVEYTLRHRKILEQKEQEEKRDVRESMLSECGDVLNRINGAFEGMNKK
jgi:actin-like ATPase involved in cell morphogenesis